MNTVTSRHEFEKYIHEHYGDWALPTLEANKSLIQAKDTREIGKSRQHSAEFLVVEWLNSLALGLDVKTQKEIHVLKENSDILPEFDHNESGFDAYCINTKTRFQIKYRGGGGIHMEQTRRTSEKNKGPGSTSGHVLYSSGEFDVLVVVRPEEISLSFDASNDILVFPEGDLRNPKKPGFLFGSVKRSLEKEVRSKIAEDSIEIVLKNAIEQKGVSWK